LGNGLQKESHKADASGGTGKGESVLLEIETEWPQVLVGPGSMRTRFSYDAALFAFLKNEERKRLRNEKSSLF
jgi:hypothetical protein